MFLFVFIFIFYKYYYLIFFTYLLLFIFCFIWYNIFLNIFPYIDIFNYIIIYFFINLMAQHLSYTVLYCAIEYSTLLNNTVLYSTVLYFNLQRIIILYCTVHFCTINEITQWLHAAYIFQCNVSYIFQHCTVWNLSYPTVQQYCTVHTKKTKTLTYQHVSQYCTLQYSTIISNLYQKEPCNSKLPRVFSRHPPLAQNLNMCWFVWC